MASEELFPILDEQVSVGFTGKVNVLDPSNNRHLGVIELFEGEVFEAKYGGVSGLKAFYNVCVAAFEEGSSFKYVVEPELVQTTNKIHYPYNVLKRKVAQIVEIYKENKALRPPDELKLLVNPRFVEAGEPVSATEFDLLSSIADYNSVKEIYKNCELLDYQITNALVSLRKKKAITVVKKG